MWQFLEILVGKIMRVALLGDGHGSLLRLQSLWYEKKYRGKIVQVGDLGFADTYHKLQQRPYKDNLMVVPGNHDDYYAIANGKLPQSLGDWGIIPGTESTGFLRGAWSIDWRYRIPGISWWSEEELSFQQLEEFLKWYIETKPRVMVSHETHPVICYLINGDYIPSKTGDLIKEAFEHHKPERWYHGHHHKQFEYNYKGCIFRCLDIDEVLMVDLP